MALKKNIGRKTPAAPLALWAVDPLVTDPGLQREAAAAIQTLQRKIRLRVQPVYISAPSSHPFLAFREKVQERLDALVAADPLLAPARLLPLEMVETREHSVSGRVSTLLRFARQHGARLIVLSTRARRGPARWFLGSFAETLSLQSDIPLLIVNPSWKKLAHDGVTDFDEILFPTDFSGRSREAYTRVLAFAASSGLPVCVFHKYGSDIGPAWDFNLVPSPTLSETGNEELLELRRELEEWRKDGEDAGVRTTVELDTDSGAVVECILRRAEAAHCIVAMSARSSKIEAIMLGSITRQLIREAAAPVWILCEPREAPARENAA